MLIDSSMVISGFVSKVINDCGDVLKSKIISADKNRKSSEQNIETRIYQVTVDAINVFMFDTYKEQDILYDAAESILRGFKIQKENIEAVKAGLKMLESQITDGICEGFLRILRHEICKDENDILYKEIVLIQLEQVMGDMREGFIKSRYNEEKALDKSDLVIKKLENKAVTLKKLIIFLSYCW
ncbi:MAG: hypothetical protein K2K70_01085, partial [Lachnospiraceae bacterium]|nr:hypothetical protein [Lachnospiraceae bacterium]